MIHLSRMGLLKKTFIFVGAGFAALMALLTFISLDTVNQGIEIASREKLAVAENIASNIDDIILHLHFETAYTASVLGNNWQKVDAESDRSERLVSLRNHLLRHMASFRQVDAVVFVALLDSGGNVLQMEPAPEQGIAQSVAAAPAIQQVLAGDEEYIEVEKAILTGDSPTLSMVVPVKDDQQLLQGMIVADIPVIPGNFDSLLQRWGAEHDLQVISETGTIVASSLRITNIGESEHWNLIGHLAQERAAGIGQHPGDEDTKAHIVAFAPLESVPWGVVLEKSTDELLELPWAMGRRLLVVGGVAILVAAGLIWGFTRQLINPIRRLAAVAESFGTGNLEAKIPPMRQDEIGELAQSLETMRCQLKQSIDETKQLNLELERRVKRRTAQLEELYEQLRLKDMERGELLGKIITVQEEERRRIARELHDDISQTLTGLVMNLRSIENLIASNPDTARKELESLRHSARGTVDNVRRLILDLRPSLLDDLGLVPAISWYLENYLAPAGVEAKLEVTGTEERLPAATEIALFRVVQEALTNIVKHARAKTALICLEFASSAIVGDIKDDGKGFSMSQVRRNGDEGIGLLGMAERIELIKGKIKIESEPEKGTRIHFEIPRQENSG
ncbi:MAG: histidine kinase [Dehalococcoidales bacterium]|nr:histidine kinase [Dehalococcoidales bacterium]